MLPGILFARVGPGLCFSYLIASLLLLPALLSKAELAEIVHDRDVEVEDRFDRLVRECTILDLEGSPSRGEVLRTVAEQLAAHLAVSADEVERLLRQREEATSTVIRPGLAIPHIVVEGTGRFDILLVRSREGIALSPDGPPVHALFVLIGSADERNYHLRALMAVAEIVQNPHFDRNWRRARTIEDLRRLILLAQRRRESPLP